MSIESQWVKCTLHRSFIVELQIKVNLYVYLLQNEE